ncbi:glycosyl hydrolase 108 family protein [Brachyspira sp.]|uniref:glycosyl hydrolase 108 family protein n=1 Tax=Brachyspira sp. TaxID=1977261 RepID=UPI003D7EF76A
MSDYKEAYELLEEFENRKTKKGLIVYSNIKEDKGGETVLGVARKIHPNLSIWDEVDKLTRKFGTKDLITLSNKILENKNITETVYEFFYKNYWLKSKCNVIENQAFACNVFLLSVNAGVKRGVKTGQEACKIAVDGIIGKNTLSAWKNAGLKEAKRYTEIEIEYYKSLVKKDATQSKFLNGWLRRANAI